MQIVFVSLTRVVVWFTSQHIAFPSSESPGLQITIPVTSYKFVPVLYTVVEENSTVNWVLVFWFLMVITYGGYRLWQEQYHVASFPGGTYDVPDIERDGDPIQYICFIIIGNKISAYLIDHSITLLWRKGQNYIINNIGHNTLFNTNCMQCGILYNRFQNGS